jgi:hypothetical protein
MNKKTATLVYISEAISNAKMKKLIKFLDEDLELDETFLVHSRNPVITDQLTDIINKAINAEAWVGKNEI